MAEKLKITPGPWLLRHEDLRGGRFWVVDRPGRQDTIDLHEDDNGEDDARAIASLPALIEAAKPFAALLCSDEDGFNRTRPFSFEDYDAKVRALRAALNKIQGGNR